MNFKKLASIITEIRNSDKREELASQHAYQAAVEELVENGEYRAVKQKEFELNLGALLEIIQPDAFNFGFNHEYCISIFEKLNPISIKTGEKYILKQLN